MDAAAAFRKAIELKSKSPDVVLSYANLARVLIAQRKFDEAVSALNKVIEIQPNNPGAYNEIAWWLSTSPAPQARIPTRAIELATRAVELAPQDASCWNTLGVARYSAGKWQSAVAALSTSMELQKGGNAFDRFFLAMAHWQLRHKDEAREWYDRAAQWMGKTDSKNEELRRFRAEAASLLGIEQKNRTGGGSLPRSGGGIVRTEDQR